MEFICIVMDRNTKDLGKMICNIYKTMKGNKVMGLRNILLDQFTRVSSQKVLKTEGVN